VLPALAICGGEAAPIRFALRSTVVLATLQVLVAYPVAGSQIGWGTVAMVVPCSIALAAGIEHIGPWRAADRLARGGVVLFLGITLILASGVWPPSLWKQYGSNPSLGLPGTGLMHIDRSQAAVLQAVTQGLRENCDAFYGVPNENGFYIFTGLPAVTGMVANAGITGLTVEQQSQVIAALRERSRRHERVCILRDSSQGIVLPRGALTRELRRYGLVVATIGSYTITRHK
jgi:hypothetical protein